MNIIIIASIITLIPILIIGLHFQYQLGFLHKKIKIINNEERIVKNIFNDKKYLQVKDEEGWFILEELTEDKKQNLIKEKNKLIKMNKLIEFKVNDIDCNYVNTNNIKEINKTENCIELYLNTGQTKILKYNNKEERDLDHNLIFSNIKEKYYLEKIKILENKLNNRYYDDWF
jgi:hypothetical protein